MQHVIIAAVAMLVTLWRRRVQERRLALPDWRLQVLEDCMECRRCARFKVSVDHLRRLAEQQSRSVARLRPWMVQGAANPG